MPSTRRRILRMMYTGNCLGILAAPPCTTYSIAQRPALRSADHLEGKPGLDERGQQRVSTADRLTKWLADILSIASSLKIPWMIENPQTSLLWSMPWIRSLAKADTVQTVVLDQCSYGVPWKKPTRLLASRLTALEKLGRRCRPYGVPRRCSHTDRPHVILSGQSQGKCKTSHAAAFPEEMCSELANIFCDTAFLQEFAFRAMMIK